VGSGRPSRLQQTEMETENEDTRAQLGSTGLRRILRSTRRQDSAHLRLLECVEARLRRCCHTSWQRQLLRGPSRRQRCWSLTPPFDRYEHWGERLRRSSTHLQHGYQFD